MDKRTFSYQEVAESMKASNNESPDDALFGHVFTKDTKFALRELEVTSLHRDHCEHPDSPLHYENPPEYDRNKNLVGGDEYWAQKFALEYPSGETAQPIVVSKTFDIIDGRHRARAAFIRGEQRILAYFEIAE